MGKARPVTGKALPVVGKARPAIGTALLVMGKTLPGTETALPAMRQNYFRLKWSTEELYMAKKIAKYTLPRSEEALDTLANSVLTYATPHIEGAEADWTDIPPAIWAAYSVE
jgi:hypothetical protein